MRFAGCKVNIRQPRDIHTRHEEIVHVWLEVHGECIEGVHPVNLAQTVALNEDTDAAVNKCIVVQG